MIIVTALLGVVLSALVVIKRKKDRELNMIEKKLLETDFQNKELASKKLQTEIVFKTKQLTTHALNMMQKNQILTGIRERLNTL